MNNITKNEFYLMLENGANLLMNHREEIDRLNVFPVPDGDTGSNMSKTMLSGIETIRNKEKFESISEMSNSFSRGLLMGARGNSGVIMSQIFKGLSNGLSSCEETITATQLVSAFTEAKIAAYKAVINPVEGTILTVIKDMASYAEKNIELFKTNPKKLLKMIYEAGLVSLKNTPELLPQLKQAGVVDSGGTGLMYIISGFVKALENKKVDLTVKMESNTTQGALKDIDYTKLDNSLTEHFCTEFFVININEKEFKQAEYQAQLEKLGDSIVIVQDQNIVKTHLHTDNPGNALQIGLKYGDLDGIKIENMRIQHNMSEFEKTHLRHTDASNLFVISVATGTQMSEIFKENGVDYIVDGGQTANPSIGDFVTAIKEANNKEIIIFPNNSNIILAAQEAAKMYADKQIHVVPTKEYTEGFALARLINKEYSAEANYEQLLEILEGLTTLKVTTAVKDTKFDEVEITKGQYITIIGKQIKASQNTIIESFKTANQGKVDHEIAVVFFGQEITMSEKTKIIEELEKNVDEIEIFETNQPVYPVIISFE